MSQLLKVCDLTPHEKNNVFFDDISGDAWTEFLESVKTSGVIEPIVVDTNMTIVSGHQRVRACKALGIEEILAEIRIFDSEDEELKQLIETNIRQRGIGNTNPVKFGQCLKELERIYGIREGSAGGTGANQYTGEVESNNFTEADLADTLGVTRQTLQNYKQLANAIPEVQTLVETGVVTATTALALIHKLPDFQQKEVAEQLIEDGKKATKKEVEQLMAEVKRLEAANVENMRQRDKIIDELRNKQAAEPSNQREKFEKARADRLTEENKALKEKVAELEAREPETEEVEVYPDDYDDLQEENAGLRRKIAENAKIELNNFVLKYIDYCNIKSLLKDCLDKIAQETDE